MAFLNWVKKPTTRLYLFSLAIIIIYSIGLLGGLIGYVGFLYFGIEEISKQTGFNKIILYYGWTLGLSTSAIYIIGAINLIRKRYWARKLFLWILPIFIIHDIIYFSFIHQLNKSTSTTLGIELLLWIILLNKDVSNLFIKPSTLSTHSNA